ncbi:MAG: hypothetical protein ACK5QB_18035 [Pseudanabaena sp.]
MSDFCIVKIFTSFSHKPDRLFPQIKQRSPLITNKPDRLFPTTNRDRQTINQQISIMRFF